MILLVVSRKVGEQIKLSNGIVITIAGLDKGRVKVGVDAPKQIGVHRSDPCKGCGTACFDYYLGLKDIPFCGSSQCERRIKLNEPTFRRNDTHGNE